MGLQLNFLPQPANVSSRSIVVLDMNSLVREICIGTELLQKLSFASDAPPVFILDALRLRGTNPILDDMFDNRWMVFPQDFPSARFFAEKKIKLVTLVQVEKAQPLRIFPTCFCDGKRRALRFWQQEWRHECAIANNCIQTFEI